MTLVAQRPSMKLNISSCHQPVVLTTFQKHSQMFLEYNLLTSSTVSSFSKDLLFLYSN